MGRNKGFRKEDVLDTSIQLFWKQGFSETSLSDLEAATGVNKSGLYAEFKDKDTLYIACLQHYISKSGIIDLLSREPLGWENITTFLLAGQTCKGEKGCFVANSVREAAILPRRARSLIHSHIKAVKKLLTRNLQAANIQTEAPSHTDIILTFNTGLCLERNLRAGGDYAKRIQKFLQVLQNSL